MNKKIFLAYLIVCLTSKFINVEAITNSNNNLVQPRRISNGLCIPLKDCQELLWLLQNKHNVPGMAFHEVLQYLQDQMCGYEGNDPRVKCNITEDEIVIADPDEQTMLMHTSRMEVRHGGVIDVRDNNVPRA